MKIYDWNRLDAYDYLIVCSKSEAFQLLRKTLEQFNYKDFSFNGDYYFLATEDFNIISPIPFLEYAFSYENQPPYGTERKDLNPDFKDSAFHSFEQVQLHQKKKGLGAVVGDIAGSRYEYIPQKEQLNSFDLINGVSHITDDSLLMIAAADGLISGIEKAGENWAEDERKQQIIKNQLQASFRFYSEIFKNVDFEDDYYRWLLSNKPRPYKDSHANILLQAVFAGWYGQSLDEAQLLAQIISSVTRSNEDAKLAAKTAAGALFILRTTKNKTEFKKFIQDSLSQYKPKDNEPSMAIEDIRQAYTYVMNAESYMQAVKEAVKDNYGDNAKVSLTGAFAEALFPIPNYIKIKAIRRLPGFLARSLYHSINVLNNPMALS